MSNRIDNISIPDQNSLCQEWRTYFDNLKVKYGTKNARESWLYTWNQKGNSSCTKSKDFNQWAEDNDISVADGFDRAVAGVSGIGQNVINGIGTITGIAPKVATVVAITGLGIGLYFLFRAAKEIKPSDAIQMLPAGKAGSMLKALK